MHYKNKCTSCDLMMKLTRFVITIKFAADKCRKLTLFKNQNSNDLEQKEKDNTPPSKVGKIHVYVCFVVLFVFFGGQLCM